MNELSTVGRGFAEPTTDDAASSAAWTCQRGHLNQPGRHFCAMCGEQLHDRSSDVTVTAPAFADSGVSSAPSVQGSDAARFENERVATSVVDSSRGDGSWVIVTAFVALAAWTAAGWSSLAVKLSADKVIRDYQDVSAIQVQQLNGSVTAHAVVAMVIALGATIPLLIALWARACSLLDTRR